MYFFHLFMASYRALRNKTEAKNTKQCLFHVRANVKRMVLIWFFDKVWGKHIVVISGRERKPSEAWIAQMKLENSMKLALAANVVESLVEGTRGYSTMPTPPWNSMSWPCSFVAVTCSVFYYFIFTCVGQRKSINFNMQTYRGICNVWDLR